MNNSMLAEAPPPPEPILSDETRLWMETMIVFVRLPFHCMGIITNALNIRVFIQQGLTSSSNTTCLFALAIADCFFSLFGIPSCACYILYYVSTPYQYFNCRLIVTYCFGSPIVMMSRINCLITIYIAIERCMCVLIPLKVKMIFRPKTAAIAMATVWLSIIASYICVFMNTRIAWQFVSAINQTLVLIIETEFGKVYFKYTTFFIYTILPPIAIFIVAIANGLMLYKLNKYKKWRQSNVSQGLDQSGLGDKGDSKQPNAQSGQTKKDIEMLKLVLIVTGMFLIVQTIGLFPGFASFFVTGFSFTGLNRNMFTVAYGCMVLFDSMNASLNFFFYIRISSRYREAFNEVFQRRARKA